MKRLIFCTLAMACSLLFSAWGFYAHKLINGQAIYSLPPPLSIFFKHHHQLIVDKSVNADKRRYIDSLESSRHFIDLDKYEEEEVIDTTKTYWIKASERYGEQLLRARGIVPWQIQKTYQQLVHAFIEKDAEQIINKAADLGHYVADAHVPLHTSMNYNGQLTGQIGIHAFWESRLPEQFAKNYKLNVGPARYIANTQKLAWKIVEESNKLVDKVLDTEKQLSLTFPKNLQKSFISRQQQVTSTYSDAYSEAYHQQLKGMVEARIRLSIQRLASYWYSAWIDAGQPTLSTNYKEKKNKKQEKEKISKALGREEWD